MTAVRVISGRTKDQLSTSKSHSIADLAAEFRVTARTLRHYEDAGLISPARVGQNRVYSTADHARLAWIMRGKRVGFSLAEISEMLDLYDLGDGRAEQCRVTLERCRKRIAALEAQRGDIDLTIAELDEFCTTLENMSEDPRRQHTG